MFGMFEWFQPNTHVDVNPFDFKRWIAGVSYQYNEFLRFSINTQNMLYYHDNFAFSQPYANKFAPDFAAPGAKLCRIRCSATDIRSSSTWSSTTNLPMPQAAGRVIWMRLAPGGRGLPSILAPGFHLIFPELERETLRELQ